MLKCLMLLTQASSLFPHFWSLMFVLQVSFRNHDSHKLYYDLYQGDGRVIDMEIIFYSTELNHNVNFLARHFSRHT